MSFVFQVVLANGDIVKTASRARKSAAGFVLLSSSSSSFFFFFFFEKLY
jgi:FAD/FMN-containing dehydrogenase